jgi:iron complex transport system substrate-binding protein
MKMRWYRVLLVGLLVLLAACAVPPPTASSPTATTAEETESTAESAAADMEANQANNSVTVTDSVGRELTIDLPVERVVVVNRQVAEALSLLGVADRVVATGDTTIENNAYLGYADRPDVGQTGELNLELILSLEPDVVFAHTNRDTEVLEEKLEPAGIHVVRIDYYRPGRMEAELQLMGEVMQAEARAAEFLAWEAEIDALREERLATLSEEERPEVMALSVGFLNSQGGYRIFPSRAADGSIGVGEGYATILAGGQDAAADLEWPPDQAGTTVLVDEEYALQKNPPIVTLHGTWLGGYNAEDDSQYREVMSNILDTTSLPQIQAAETGDVYIFHTDYLGASKRFVGTLQLAKYLHPELFSDVNPDDYLREYYEEWLGVPYQGVWHFSLKEME